MTRSTTPDGGTRRPSPPSRATRTRTARLESRIRPRLEPLLRRAVAQPSMPQRGTVGGLLRLEVSAVVVPAGDGLLGDLWLTVHLPLATTATNVPAGPGRTCSSPSQRSSATATSTTSPSSPTSRAGDRLARPASSSSRYATSSSPPTPEPTQPHISPTGVVTRPARSAAIRTDVGQPSQVFIEHGHLDPPQRAETDMRNGVLDDGLPQGRPRNTDILGRLLPRQPHRRRGPRQTLVQRCCDSGSSGRAYGRRHHPTLRPVSNLDSARNSRSQPGARTPA